MIVGAGRSNDRDILTRAESLYRQVQLKRVYYSAYVPVNPLALPGGKTVCAVVTHDSVAHLGLAVGERACAVFKASTVILCLYA